MSAVETAVLIVGLVAAVVMGGASLARAVGAHVAVMRRADERLASIEAAWTTPADPEPGAWFDRLVRHRVLIHTLDDESIEGLLAEVAPDGVVLISATYLGSTATKLGGDVFVPRSRIKLVQRARTD